MEKHWKRLYLAIRRSADLVAIILVLAAAGFAASGQ